MNREPRKVVLGGLVVDALSRQEWAQYMADYCKRKDIPKPFLHYSINGQALALCASDPTVKRLHEEADGLDADGQPLVLASRLLTSTPLPERVATTDFFHDAAAIAEKEGLSFYILAGTQENVEIAVTTIKRLYPNLIIAGYRNGYIRLEEEAAVAKQIVASGANVLWVGMGLPKQLEFINRNIDLLQGVKWIKPCGGLFDYFSPKIKRAPLWMQNFCLEWLFRMMQEPRKFFWRYLTTNGTALWLLLTRTRDYRQGG